MGHKRITEKDFWICTEGNVPAQLQSTQKTTKKVSGEKYITVKDTSTSSWIDFGCKKAMLIYAIIAAAVVVIAAMTVATGGAALIALGALAGLAGAAWGAVIGALLCGQTAAKGRKWVETPKTRMTAIQGVRQITGDCKMTCMVGGVISFAPQIKNWSQAVSLGAGNYIGGLMEGMMAGAAIGMGGAALSGGAGAFASGGMRGVGQAAWQVAKSAPMNVLRNIGATFGYAGAGASTSVAYATAGTAVGLRGLTATQAGLQHYGSTGESGWGAAGEGVFGMETGMYHSVDNLTTFHNPETGAFEWQGTWQDVTGLALLLSPVHKAAEEAKGKAKGEEPVKDGENKKADEETVKDTNVKKEEPAKQEGEHGTYEDAAAKLKEISANEFKRNPKHDAAEFKRQIEGQEKGLNDLTVEEFLKNREEYKKNGRSNEGSKAQKDYREAVKAEKIKEYRKLDRKLTYDEAKAKADAYMKDKAALHDPDQIAGGHGTNITGLGNSGINSSLGSQWKTRIENIEAQVKEQAKDMTPEQMQNTKLNIKLPWN